MLPLTQKTELAGSYDVWADFQFAVFCANPAIETILSNGRTFGVFHPVSFSEGNSKDYTLSIYIRKIFLNINPVNSYCFVLTVIHLYQFFLLLLQFYLVFLRILLV